MVKHTLTVYDVVVVVNVDVMVWMLWYFVFPVGTFPIMSKVPFALETFETRNAQYPKIDL
jgi:TRAP-type mannitol/chloroaromatic compound transport system substrate-binding protein